MRSVFIVLATAVSTALLASGVAVADTVTTNFEPPAYHPGTVNGQGAAVPWPADIHCGPNPVGSPPPPPCWKSAVPGNIPSLPNGYDQTVVANAGAPGAFGSQSLRISNAYGTGPDTFPPEYHYQTYSKPTTVAAGERESNTVYTAQFSFISVHPDRQQQGLKISVSPDMGEGGRMSYIGLEDTSDGVAVTFFETDSDGDFVGHELGTLPRNVPHTIRFWMRLVPGPDNDLVRIVIDGQDVGQCFTTWESFYRATNQSVPISDRLLFLSGNRDGNRLSLLGGGYRFDNVTTTTAPGEGPPTCDLPIEKKADASTVSAGSRVGYRITVRNRGHAVARNLRVCDHIPRRTTFVSADRKLSRFGRDRCLGIARLAPGQRVSVHLVLAVDADAPAGSLANLADITPGLPGSPDTRDSPLGTGPDLPPAARLVRAATIVRAARAVVRVRARRAGRPGVTG
jgi:uncharacterized repeat protein (TIGR01451 family)